ncbi:MAG: sugar phosphate isomerase/epimerase [Candidatus Omnitrophota bacterium]|jgi:sugar phosphate isomerase/epimerase
MTDHPAPTQPSLAAFPKAWMDPLCVTGTLSLNEWIDMGASLGVDGLEFYSGFLDLKDEANWTAYRHRVQDHGMIIPMLCCSPDFTHPDPDFRQQQIQREKSWIEMSQALGAKYCRILTGQRRPDVSRADGVAWSVECIGDCLEHAADHGITLIIENHYKDGYWNYPEFAQRMDVFCEIVDQIHHPNFGVNFDPSNTLLADEDPIVLLERIKDRVVTMHASDRYLASGTFEDLRKEELDALGYAQRLKHGEIGKGANDYDQIFSILKGAGFTGWISIEDGEDGLEELARSVAFLRDKIAKHWG